MAGWVIGYEEERDKRELSSIEENLWATQPKLRPLLTKLKRAKSQGNTKEANRLRSLIMDKLEL